MSQLGTLVLGSWRGSSFEGGNPWGKGGEAPQHQLNFILNHLTHFVNRL